MDAIVSVTSDWAIGKDGGLLVPNKADMRRFVQLTRDCTVLMGRKTLESFPGGHPLKDRRNVVVTRDESWAPDGVDVAHSLAEALDMVAADDEVWVVGGGQVYRALLPMCSRAVVTKNHCVRTCDTFFPNLDDDPAWRVESRVTTDDEGNQLVTDEQIPFEFVTYVRA